MTLRDKTTNKYKAQQKYIQNNIKKISVSVPKADKDEFVVACEALGITQAEVLKPVIYKTIEKAKKQQKIKEKNL